MRTLMAAGGTGGHIFPALAVAQELQARWNSRRESRSTVEDCVIEFLGTGRGLEARLIPAAGFPLHVVPAAGLVGMSGRRLLHNLLVLPRTCVGTARVLLEVQPDVVLGMGGYLAGPVMLEAALREIPTLLIEPNAVPGFTNRVLAPLVRVAAVGFEEAASCYGTKTRLTGHAVRKAFFEIPPKVHEPPFTVLILGGSQGSAAINKTVRESLPLLAGDATRLRLIHQTGERDYNGVCEAYRKCGVPAEVYPFIENMPEMFGRADLVISRSGAAAVAELAAAGKASLLVPFPAATDHHQLANAQAMERAGAARLVLQGELTPERLWQEAWDLFNHPQRLVALEGAARKLARPDAAARIAELLEQLACL
jgi:UDP-N-acetylglucosamine--N-acetylmuramyl-(pentapeptide) pyrophosphoryl-undecaprenol N-acetylglucosamine transferase